MTDQQFSKAMEQARTGKWLKNVASMLPEIEAALDAAKGLDWETPLNGAYAMHLVSQARQVLLDNSHLLRKGCAYDYMQGPIGDALPLVLGALHMKDAALGLPMLLEPAVNRLIQIDKILDEAALHEHDGRSPGAAAAQGVEEVRKLLLSMVQAAGRALPDPSSSEANEGEAARVAALLNAIEAGMEEAKSVSSFCWMLPMLEMVEDLMPSAQGDRSDRPPVQEVYQAIARVQEALGVPEDRRAWDFRDEGLNGKESHVAAPDRIEIASRCLTEIAQSVNVLTSIVPDLADSPHFVIKSTLCRVNKLACVALSACDDPSEPVASLRERMQ